MASYQTTTLVKNFQKNFDYFTTFNMQSLMMTYSSRHNLTTISNAFESPEYVLDLLRGFPLLESFTLAFTASEDRRWIGIEYLDYIHQLCPRLHTFKLDNAPLYVTKLSDQESTDTFVNSDTQKMQHLELRSPVFYDFEQFFLFHTYVTYKYKSILSLTAYNIRITTIRDNNNSSNTISAASLPLEKQLSKPPSTIWENLEELKFMGIRSSSAISVCKAIIQEAGKNGKLTYIFMSGKYVHKNKVHPIVVNLAWIREFCPYLKTLDMNYISLLNSDVYYLDDDILFDDNGSQPVCQGTLFRKLCLRRGTNTSTWNVQACKFERKSTSIKAIVAD
ncbi:hypothetical protein INT45_011860 [Circinella minor]|uniref:Uncharacterized protein n=1 Tax=Circinella minor TaxID=1195481 RepID=A0A8H7S188_9FUNG|nr:hypothetical protein INT45_011860 [Circinella minor]